MVKLPRVNYFVKQNIFKEGRTGGLWYGSRKDKVDDHG